MKIYNVEQKTDEWKLLRKGKITGKDLKAIVGTPATRETAFYNILAQRLSTGGLDEESDLDRGNRLEPIAIEEYEKATGMIVEKIGFAEHSHNQFIGYSPDGLVKVKSKYKGGVEVKCLNDTNHVRAWIKNEIPKEHYAQCIQSFIVNKDQEWLDVVFYNPHIKIHPLHIIRLNRIDLDDDIADYESQQKEFLLEIEEKLDEILKI